jgi:hypothetical protein
MLRLGSKVAGLIVLTTLYAGLGTAWALSGSNVLNQARAAEGGINACAAASQGQALIDCIADVMVKFSANVDRGEVPAKAPQIVTIIAQAAEIRSKPKAEAVRVLNRVASIARGLATKGAGDFQPAYSAVANVFSRAVAVIEKKG